MGYVVLVSSCLFGVALFAGGLYLVGHRTPPSWMKGGWLLPLNRVTPRISHLQGWAVLAIGTSIIAMGLAALLQEMGGGVLVLLGIAAYVAGLGLYAYSTYLSRRRAA
ncbi:MAG TPA: hypothetical protein VLR46_14900 [Candidatus Dormibacteraeota bacterium]|nr:hypothetical protein [Candidatus Dormibacteraeota bacterium]